MSFDKISVVLIFIGILFYGCGNSDSLANFSKKKYLKNAPKQKVTEQFEDSSPLLVSSVKSNSLNYKIEEIPEEDYVIEIPVVILEKIINTPKLQTKGFVKNHSLQIEPTSFKKEFKETTAGSVLKVVLIITAVILFIALVFVIAMLIAMKDHL